MVQGIFKCYIHDFGCNLPSEWNAHKAEFEHEIQGFAPCNQCGIGCEIKYKGKVGTKTPALCKECAKKLLKGMKEEEK